MNNKKTNRISAGFDNQVSTFLVNHCEEATGFEETLQNLYSCYQKVHGSVIGNSFRKTWMTDSSFKTRLVAAGLVLERRPHALHKHNWTIWVIGVRLKPSKPTEPVTVSYGYSGQSPAPAPITESTILHGEWTHVRVNGELYDRRLIARVKPIRPFEHSATGQVMSCIVTFNNPEIKHQFITAENARDLESVLGEIIYRG